MSSSPTPSHLNTLRLVQPYNPVSFWIPQRASLCNLFLLNPQYEEMFNYQSVYIDANLPNKALHPFSVIFTDARERTLNFNVEATLESYRMPSSLKLLRSRMSTLILFFNEYSLIYRTHSGPSQYPVAFKTSPATALVNFLINRLICFPFYLACFQMSFVVQTRLQNDQVQIRGDSISKADVRRGPFAIERVVKWIERDVFGA